MSWGGALYILEQFDPAEVMRALSEERISFAAIVPAMIQACLLSVPDAAERHYEQLRTIYEESHMLLAGCLRTQEAAVAGAA